MIRLRCAPPGSRPTDIELGSGAVHRWLADSAPDGAGFALLDGPIAPVLAPLLPPAWGRLVAPGGEAAKQFARLAALLEALAAAGLDRSATLFVAGGGALGDLGGLAAALYLRGIRLVVAPTTLVAMADSCVGGKNGINLSAGKNLAGTIWPPERVLVDPGLLATLPQPDWRSGFGELLKVAIGLSAELFERLDRDEERLRAGAPDLLLDAIHLALAAKVRIVEADLDERGPRRLLNLGHTLGHALERARPELPHGVAVARGLWFALDVAAARGAIAPADAGAARDLLRRFDFVADPLPPRARLAPYLRHDKKRDGERIHFVLPVGRGQSRTEAIPLAELLALIPE